MKATEVVRRFDDLGRIVIPRVIRKQLGIKEGQAMEIVIDKDENILLQKYDERSQEEEGEEEEDE